MMLPDQQPAPFAVRLRRAGKCPEMIWDLYRTQRRYNPGEGRLTSLRRVVKYFHWWCWHG